MSETIQSSPASGGSGERSEPKGDVRLSLALCAKALPRKRWSI